MGFQMEFAFTLPKGYVDRAGVIHKNGIMRLANAADEVAPLSDPRVKANSGYLAIILLARVIKELGTVPHVDTAVIENLFTADLSYLQDFYQRINAMELPEYSCTCPYCGKEAVVPVNFMQSGESL